MASTAVNSDTSVPTPSVNAKPLTPAVASMKRMNATPIVTTFASMIVGAPSSTRRRWPPGSICPARTSSFIRSKMTMFASAATARVEDQAGDARQRERDRDQLDQREQQHRVDRAAPRSPPGRAPGRRRAGRGASAPGPTAPAIRPWSSACWPSVAETCVSEISLRSIGSAPMRRLSARSLVVVEVCRCPRSARRCGRRSPRGSRR